MPPPRPEDSWAQVELYLRQHKELPPADPDKCKPLSIPEGLRGMAEEIRDAITKKDMSECPPPFSVISVLLYVANYIEEGKQETRNKKQQIKTWKK